MVEKLVSDPFSKKSKLSISLDQQFEVLYNVFTVGPSRGLPTYMTIRRQHLAFTSYKVVKKQKRSGTSLPASFFA